MSDVSKTNEATDAQVLAASEVLRELWKPHMPSWVALSRGTRAALRAAAEVRGEPNDDRTPEFESIEQELFKHQPLLSMQDGSIRGCKCMDRVFHAKAEDWGTHLAEVFTRLSRATVPDAATAAIAKVRAIHRRVNVVDDLSDERLGDACEVCCEIEGYELDWPCPTVAALDAAPEPEWEYSCATWYEGEISAYGATWGSPDVFTVPKRDFLVRRRPASEWLPVEGESKP